MSENKLESIEDYQRDMAENSKRWFPHKEESPDLTYDIVRLVAEAGEILKEYHHYLRGDFDVRTLVDKALEESLDLFHFVLLLWDRFDYDFKTAYINKTKFNEERFGGPKCTCPFFKDVNMHLTDLCCPVHAEEGHPDERRS